MESLILPPFREFDPTRDVTQFFGTNRAYYNSNFGLPGHNGLDVKKRDGANMSYGYPLVAQHEVEYLKWEEDFPAKTRGSGLWLRKELDTPITIAGRSAHYLETLHWHLSDITIYNLPKDDTGRRSVQIHADTTVALMGNTGHVFPKPTATCPYCGTHDHNAIQFYDQYGGLISSEYGGYRDPLMWMHQDGWKYNMRFSRDLWLGSSGDDVSWLQSILKIDLRTTDYEPIGFFGPKTLRDVRAFQVKHGISPAFGYVGRITRSFINKKYTTYG